MSRSSALILLGILVILAPFSGLPASLRSLLSIVLGACVLGIGAALRARETHRAAPPAPAPPPEAPPQGVSPI